MKRKRESALGRTTCLHGTLLAAGSTHVGHIEGEAQGVQTA
jgi:hypothetical protein